MSNLISANKFNVHIYKTFNSFEKFLTAHYLMYD